MQPANPNPVITKVNTASRPYHSGIRPRRSEATNLMPSKGETRPAIQAGMNIAKIETIGPNSPAVTKGAGVIRIPHRASRGFSVGSNISDGAWRSAWGRGFGSKMR